MTRVLVAVARLNDTVRAFASEFEQQIKGALEFGLQTGVVVLSVIPASEGALRTSLSGGRWDVLHLIAPVRVIPAARYATVDFESSSGSTRSLSAEYLCGLLGEQPVRCLVFYSSDAKSSFEMIAAELARRCTSAVITAQGLRPGEMTTFLAKLHATLTDGHISDTLPLEFPGVRVWKKDAPPPPVITPPLTPPAVKASLDDEWRRVILEKRQQGQFDVFLCHNHLDKPRVRTIAEQLERAKILPWLDDRELPPGMPWIPLLERQIGNIKSAAVFVGASGIGP